MNERRFYQMAKFEYSKHSFYHAIAHFLHTIEMRSNPKEKHGHEISVVERLYGGESTTAKSR